MAKKKNGKSDIGTNGKTEFSKRNKSLLGYNQIFTPEVIDDIHIKSELTDSDIGWLKRKLKVAEIGDNFDVSKMTKVVAGKKLWNYDNLEPTEKKGAI